MLSAKIRTKWIIGRTKWIIEYFSYLALVEYCAKWIRIKWGPGVFNFKTTLQMFKRIYREIREQGFQIYSQFAMSKKLSDSFWFFLLKNMNIGEHFLSLTFFDNITLFSKMMPNFWQLATTPILKIQYSSFLAKNLSNFVSFLRAPLMHFQKIFFQKGFL